MQDAHCHILLVAELADTVAAQLHPWFRKGLPPGINKDTYNAHYLRLSRETGDAAAAIRAVICEAVRQPPPPEPAPTPEARQQPGFWASEGFHDAPSKASVPPPKAAPICAAPATL